MALKVFMLVRELATGTQTYTENVIRKLQEVGVDVLVGFTGPEPLSLPCPVVRLDRGIPSSVDRKYQAQSFRFILVILNARRVLREFRPDIIYSQGLDEVGVLGVLTSVVFGIPVISFVHDLTLNELLLHSRVSGLGLLYGLSLFRQRLIVHRFAAVLVSSEFMRKSLQRMFGVDSKVTALGVSEEFFQSRPINVDGGFQAVVVGNLTAKKNPEAPIRALKLLSDLNVRLAFVGDGPEKSRLIELCRDLELTGRVSFHGRLSRSDLIKVVQSSQVCLIPSRWEGFSLAAVEAMALGIPVIASNEGGLTEIVKDGFNGYLVPAGNYDLMAASIRGLYVDREKLRSISNNCEEDARKYNWNHTCSRTLEVIRTVLGQVNRNGLDYPTPDHPL